MPAFNSWNTSKLNTTKIIFEPLLIKLMISKEHTVEQGRWVVQTLDLMLWSTSID